MIELLSKGLCGGLPAKVTRISLRNPPATATYEVTPPIRAIIDAAHRNSGRMRGVGMGSSGRMPAVGTQSKFAWIAGLSAAPADAHPSVRRAVQRVLVHAGGHGAVRELVDSVLAAESDG